MFQALVRLSKAGYTPALYVFASAEEREEAVKTNPNVWWYWFPEDDESFIGSKWRKGGAWFPQRADEDPGEEDDRW